MPSARWADGVGSARPDTSQHPIDMCGVCDEGVRGAIPVVADVRPAERGAACGMRRSGTGRRRCVRGAGREAPCPRSGVARIRSVPGRGPSASIPSYARRPAARSGCGGARRVCMVEASEAGNSPWRASAGVRPVTAWTSPRAGFGLPFAAAAPSNRWCVALSRGRSGRRPPAPVPSRSRARIGGQRE